MTGFHLPQEFKVEEEEGESQWGIHSVTESDF
jgi:hypothetical protein